MANMESGRAREEIARRRTFAIISHPDAGKTTLTEKLLLFGGAIHLAGSVTQRRNERQTTSDWMELERQRGISVSTSVLQFEYEGRRLNLLDTPGHNDFSEDTYRTLAAADCAVMLIDSVKGVELQTTKLFAVCRMRSIPIVTFINKMDRNGREPLELLDEIERVLEIPCYPANWPVGAGHQFQGVYDRMNRRMLSFKHSGDRSRALPTHVSDLHDAEFRATLGDGAHQRLVGELDLLDGAGCTWDKNRFLDGQVTPVFFGSAMTTSGVEPFLQEFVQLAPGPRQRMTSVGVLEPNAPEFSAFVFKIQANMDARHRDRIAFCRVCSGAFRPGMSVTHVRTGKTMLLNKAFQFLAQERIHVSEAFSGDVIGLWDPGILRIGDSLSEGVGLEFQGIPRFSPEHFVRVRDVDPMKRKQLKKGLEQIADEGAVQLFFDRQRQERDPILGAVGVLQFDVTKHRLNAEYGATVAFESLPYVHARWVEGDADLDRFYRPGTSTCLLDVEGRPLVLFSSDWALQCACRDHPELKFLAAVQPARSSRAAVRRTAR